MSLTISRRTFLSATAAGAASLAFRGARADDDERFAIGIQSYSLRGYSTDDAIRHAGEIGFKHIEFFDSHLSVKATDEQIADVKQKMKAAGMAMLGHGVSRLTADHEANKRIFEFARRAGLRNIIANPTRDAFDSLDKLVAEYGIRVAIHNHGPKSDYDLIVDVLNAVKDHHPMIGACADLGHYIRSGEDPVRAIRLFDKRLFGIHLKDFDAPRGDAKGVILGKGVLNVEEVFRALRQVQFPADGCLSLEYEENPSNPLADIKECLAVAQEAARKASA